MKKLILDIEDEELWKKVQKYKIDKELNNNNEAVVELIKTALKVNEKYG